MMPMHLRYGSWYRHECEHQCVDVDMYRQTLMLWYPWWSKARPRKHGLGVSRFAAHFWAKQIYMALSCCHMSETVALCSHSPDVAEAFFGKWLEGPWTNARSVISVTLARQYGGQWGQTCKKCRGSFVFCQSERRLLKSLIDSQHLKRSRSNQKIFRLSRLSHLRSSCCWDNRLERVRLKFKWNQAKGQAYERHQPDILEVENAGSRACPALEQVRCSQTNSQSQLTLCKQ